MADGSPSNLPRPRELDPGILRCTLPGVLLGVFGAAGTVAVCTVAAVYSGSYLSWEAIGLVTAFWCGAALLGGIVAGGVISPLVVILKGRGRLAILPGLIVAGLYLANALVARNAIISNDPIGKTVFLSVYFITAWAILLGVITGVLVIQSKRLGDWGATSVMLLSVLVSCGLAHFVWRQAGAFAFVAGPLALSAFVIAMLDKLRKAVLRAAGVGAAAAAYAAALFVAADVAGEKPLAPIERGVPAEAARAATPAGKPNVIIIVIDTMRQNHTSLCGYEYRTTAYLEALAADCQFYPNGVATDSCTLPSHASLFTGMYPREHGAHTGTARPVTTIERYKCNLIALDPSRKTLATYLSQEGYDTGGIAANYSRLCRQLGLDQGFSYYYDLPRFLVFSPALAPVYDLALNGLDSMFGTNGKLVVGTHSAEDVTHMATSWLARPRGGRPFFLFLNYMDVHHPYSAPPPYDAIDGPGIGYNDILRLPAWMNFIKNYMTTGEGLTPELLRQIVNQYDGGLAYTDHWVGEFIETLKRQGLYDNTLLVITSDHGECFGEHRVLTHSVEVYENAVKIPILVKYPHEEHKGEVRSERVSIMDIFGTVFDVLKLPLPAVTAQPLDKVTHAIMIENYNPGIQRGTYDSGMKRALTVIYSGDYKYTHSTTGRNELYDLAADPGELDDLVNKKRDVAARMEAQVEEYLAKTPAFTPAPSAAAPHEPDNSAGVPSASSITD